MPSAQASIGEHGRHQSLWDDAETYFQVLKAFLADVEADGT